VARGLEGTELGDPFVRAFNRFGFTCFAQIEIL